MEATPENLNWANTVLIFKKAEGKKSRNYREIIDGCLGLGRQPSTLIKSIGSEPRCLDSSNMTGHITHHLCLSVSSSENGNKNNTSLMWLLKA